MSNLAANIIRGERLYTCDTYKADEYDLYVLRRAGDLAPLERERMTLVLERENDPRQDELYEVCARDLGDVERITGAYRKWLGEHREWLDETL